MEILRYDRTCLEWMVKSGVIIFRRNVKSILLYIKIIIIIIPSSLVLDFIWRSLFINKNKFFGEKVYCNLKKFNIKSIDLKICSISCFISSLHWIELDNSLNSLKWPWKHIRENHGKFEDKYLPSQELKKKLLTCSTILLFRINHRINKRSIKSNVFKRGETRKISQVVEDLRAFHHLVVVVTRRLDSRTSLI